MSIVSLARVWASPYYQTTGVKARPLIHYLPSMESCCMLPGNGIPVEADNLSASSQNAL